eukprot:g2850.t1
MYRPIKSPKSDRKSPTLPVIEEEAEEAAVTRIVLLKRTFLPVGAAEGNGTRGDQDFYAKIEQKRIERELNIKKAASLRPAAGTPAVARKDRPLPRRLRPKSQSPRALDARALKKLTLHAKGEGYHKRLSELQAKVDAWCRIKMSKPARVCVSEAALKTDSTIDRLDFTRLLSSTLEITYLDDALDIRNLIFRDESVQLSRDELDMYILPVLEWEALFAATGLSRRHVPRRPASHLELLLEVSLNDCKPVAPDIVSAARKALSEDECEDENAQHGNAIDKIVRRETRNADAFAPPPQIQRSAWLAYYYTLKGIAIVPAPSHPPKQPNNAKPLSKRCSQQRISGPSDINHFWTENTVNQMLPSLAWMRVVAFLRVDWVRSPGAFEDIQLCREHLMPPPSRTCLSKSSFEKFVKTVEFFLNYRRNLSDTLNKDTMQKPSKTAISSLPVTRIRMIDMAEIVNRWEGRASLEEEEPEDPEVEGGDVDVYTPPLLQELSKRVELETKTLSVAEWVRAVYTVGEQTVIAL